MLKHDEIIKYAIKGLEAEIAEHEKKIQKGYKYLKEIQAGNQVNTPKTESEIMDIINKSKTEIERLADEIFNLKWHYL